MKKNNASGLTDKQEKFCREYVLDFNGARAAIAAGYSKKGADVTASKALRITKVADFIKSLQESVNDRLEVTAERIVAEYAKIGFANISDLMKEGMSFEDVVKLPRNVSAAIESVNIITTQTDFTTTTNVKIKMHSKTAALDALGKHTGIYKEDNKQKSDLFKAFLGIDTDKV